jgi:lysophospholipase L1-like esterase
MDLDGETPKPLRQGEAGVNPCYLNGIKGCLSITQSTTTSNDVKWYFTREEEGAEVHIREAEELITQASLYRRSGILILWTGTNDGFQIPFDSSLKLLIKKQKVMIDYLKDADKKYIVIGLTHLKDIASSVIDNINKELEKVYGRHFLDIRKYLLEKGLQESGLQETDQDRLDIRNGNIPESLRVDEVHFNAHGYTLIGQQVYEKGSELGYW